MKFNELSQLWCEQNATSVNICYSYRVEIKSIIKHLNRFFGELEVCDIRPIDISSMINDLSENNPNTGKPMSKQMLKTLVNTTYRIFDMAVDNDWLRKNPAKGKTRLIPKNAPIKKVEGIPKTEQMLIIGTPHRCRIAALVMMFMGLRTSELLALKWRNIDLAGKRAYICEHVEKISSNRYRITQGTKNGNSRYVTIPDNMCKYLQVEIKKATSEYVFPKTDGNINTPSSWRSAWRSYLNTINYYYYAKVCNIDISMISKNSPKGYPKLIKINPHQLRHTYATLLYFSNVDLLTGSKLLGHSTVGFTLNTYTHLDEKHKRLDISNLNDYISSNLDEL